MGGVRGWAWGLSLFLLPGVAAATLSIFEHGSGIKAQGFGGVGLVAAEDAISLAANPASALAIAHRLDLGLDAFTIRATASYRGNAAGPDQGFKNQGKQYFAIPQFGYSRPLGERLAVGLTAVGAGLGPDYAPASPFERFGGPERSSLSFAQYGLSAVLALQIHPQHRVGLSLNPSYQVLRVQGIQPFTALSAEPERVTDQGKDGRFGIGYTLGWQGQFGDDWRAGVAYRSKTYAERHRRYAGLLPDRGRLEAPAFYGAALAWTGLPALTLAVEVQRFEHAAEPALGNPRSRLDDGHLLGSARGPGFGHADQNVLKLGLAWQALPQLKLRVGGIRATQIIQPGETLFGILGAVTPTTHFTAGFTLDHAHWEWSGMAFHTPRQTVRGRDSIPAELGGGDADLAMEGIGIGFALGRRF